jgi:hypothetical protein
MKEPVDHILRPGLPWRRGVGAITECGLDAEGAKTITRDEYVQRRKDLGAQRASMFTCMTCSQTSDRWQTWDDDPRVAMARDIEWERGAAYWHARTDRGCRLKDELTAIAALIEAHREEFDESIRAGEARRDWLEKKAAMERKPKAAPSRSL